MVTTRAEVITHARVNIDLTEGWEYRVKSIFVSSDGHKWAGYDSDEDSWEPTENVEACQVLLRRFWNEIGLDDNDYGHGHVVMASKEWIELERRVQGRFSPKKKYKPEPKHRLDESGREALSQTMLDQGREEDLASGVAPNPIPSGLRHIPLHPSQRRRQALHLFQRTPSWDIQSKIFLRQTG
ncbi:hypothetical protein B0H14DRAFT_2571781 [Mycena olivaceomarginata]|nr:hypothetical protein B0H14DRAFT_2571781 [Mycena olivaceomarginata]